MTRRVGLVLLAAVLVAFLTASDRFAPLLRPLTTNGAPAIYAQTSLLRLTLSHLALVGAAVAVSTAVAVGFAIFVTRPAGRDLLPLARSVASIGQTFPPVAVLALAVPAMGFGAGPTLLGYG